MHELSIASSIIDLAIDESEKRGGAAVRTIFLKLGPLSGIVKRALASAFELAREDSPLADSELVIEDVPLVVFCANCNAKQSLVSIQDLSCPDCGTPCGDVISGRELEITALEIEA